MESDGGLAAIPFSIVLYTAYRSHHSPKGRLEDFKSGS